MRLSTAVGLAVLTGVMIAAVAEWMLFVAFHPQRGGTSVDVTKLALTVVGGVGGVVALVIAYRRQRDLEQGRFVERFGAAAAQLGATDVAVRIAGVYAMAGVADESEGLRRQQCIDVLCGYLRLPYDPEQGGSGRTKRVVTTSTARLADDLDPGKVEEHQEYRQNDREVRATIVRVIAAHLRGTAEYSWSASDFDFRTAYLEDIDLSATTFSGAALFGRATFAGEARFSYATFSGEARFDHTTFSTEAWFDHTTFAGEARFDHATFSTDAWFSGATFSSTARFETATFSGESQFSRATFSGNAWFGGATFSGTARFSRAKVSGDTWFGETTFSSTALFGRAAFSGDVFFDQAKLSDTAFDSATFSGNTFFDNTVFSDNASFDHTTFSGEARFIRTRFSDQAWFNHATFSGIAWFDDAAFDGTTRFSYATFSSDALFGRAAFARSASFENVNFDGRRVTFDHPKQWGPPAPIFDWSSDLSRKPHNVEPDNWPPDVVLQPPSE